MRQVDKKRSKEKAPKTSLRSHYEKLKDGYSISRKAKFFSNADAVVGYSQDILSDFNSAIGQLKDWDNSEESFTPAVGNRKPFVPDEPASTHQLVRLLKNQTQTRFCDLDFTFLDYEVGFLRATGVDDRTSGAGGLDILGFNHDGPVLIEAKLNADKDTLFALVQLLTYASELNIEKQISRFNRQYAQKFTQDSNMTLVILHTNFNERSGARQTLRNAANKLAENVIDELGGYMPIRRILCYNGTWDAKAGEFQYRLLWKVDKNGK